MTDAVTGRRTSEQRERQREREREKGGAIYAGEEDISWYPDGHNSRRKRRRRQ